MSIDVFSPKKSARSILAVADQDKRQSAQHLCAWNQQSYLHFLTLKQIKFGTMTGILQAFFICPGY